MGEQEDEVTRLREEKDGLEHEIFKERISGIHGEVISMSDTLHQRITDVEKRNDIEFNHIKEGIDQVLQVANDTLKQTKSTNGRVTELEKKEIANKILREASEKKLDDTVKHTKVVRFMHKYPVVTTIIFLIAYLFSMPGVREYTWKGIQDFFSLFGKLF